MSKRDERGRGETYYTKVVYFEKTHPFRFNLPFTQKLKLKMSSIENFYNFVMIGINRRRKGAIDQSLRTICLRDRGRWNIKKSEIDFYNGRGASGKVHPKGQSCLSLEKPLRYRPTTDISKVKKWKFTNENVSTFLVQRGSREKEKVLWINTLGRFI